MELELNLFLFDGEGGTGASEGTGEVGESTITEPVAEVITTSNTLEEKEKSFRDMISGEYKELYQKDIDRIVNKRFKETKNLEAKLNSQQGIMDLLSQRYGTTDANIIAQKMDSDDSYWVDAADEAGMSVEQYKEFSKLKKQNKELIERAQLEERTSKARSQVAQWLQQGEAVKAKYPGFDLNKESEDPRFLNMLKTGVPMEQAYLVNHMDEVMSNAIVTTKAQTEKSIVDNVRAKGNRPSENGSTSNSAFQVKNDVSKLTKAERAEIAKRARMGETISFG